MLDYRVNVDDVHNILHVSKNEWIMNQLQRLMFGRRFKLPRINTKTFSIFIYEVIPTVRWITNNNTINYISFDSRRISFSFSIICVFFATKNKIFAGNGIFPRMSRSNRSDLMYQTNQTNELMRMFLFIVNGRYLHMRTIVLAKCWFDFAIHFTLNSSWWLHIDQILQIYNNLI